MDQDRISQRAYAIWESAGQPVGAHEEHWQQARREIEAGDDTLEPDAAVMNEAAADPEAKSAKPGG